MAVSMAVWLLILVAVGASADMPLEEVFLLKHVKMIESPLAVTVDKVVKIFNDRRHCNRQEHTEICKKCLISRSIQNMLLSERENPIPDLENYNVTNATTSNQDIIKISVIMLNNLLTLESSCTQKNWKKRLVGNCENYSDCYLELMNALPRRMDTDEDILYDSEVLLKKIKPNYKPYNHTEFFRAEDVLSALNETNDVYRNMARELIVFSIISGYLFKGLSIQVKDSENDFLDDIFLHYGEHCGDYIPQSGFQKLLTDLQMQRQKEHVDHEELESSCLTVLETTTTVEFDSTIDSEHQDMLEIMGIHVTNKNEETEFKGTEAKNEKTVHSRPLKPGVTSPYLIEKNETIATKPSPQSEMETTNISMLPLKSSQKDSEKKTEFILQGTLKNATLESSTIPSSLTDEDASQPLQVNKVPEINTTFSETEEKPVQRRARRTPIPHQGYKPRSLANECLTPYALLKQFSISADDAITQEEFIEICPALVQQAVSGVCKIKTTELADFKTAEVSDASVNASSIESDVTSPSKYSITYAVAADTVITLLSFLGIILIPVMNKGVYSYISQLFVGLAFGTMLGDVTIHIIPQYLGAHAHEEAKEFSWSHAFPETSLLQITFMFTIYSFVLFSNTFAMFTKDKRHEDGGHSHLSPEIPMETFKAESSSDTTVRVDEILPSEDGDSEKDSGLLYGFTPGALIITLADTLHNFADGIAIGVSFTVSPKDGLSAAIAIFFHELPHEIGNVFYQLISVI
ncbi:zinc transporter ZIP10-like [Stegodyphus dumicola]|uniref:zinc transporter ZIP10-like n=1 Tax=Stegodyphus dumicola TaxID=202533 RepID=UPI0015B1A848|nr:zinc transporter ZIP10-like [Stegodyphus dumicola]